MLYTLKQQTTLIC